MSPSPADNPELLDGADPEKDCQRDPALQRVPPPDNEPAPDADEDESEAEHHVSWLRLSETPGPPDALRAWKPVRGRWSVLLERLALAVERPVNRLTTPQLNPLYHTGTIAFFLLLVVGATGVYLFFFFQYGYDASYNAVNRMEGFFIARTIRAVHRYASGALVITTLLHAYRTLFLEKFRGPRWLAWLTGVVMTVMVWLAGVTGYALIWDVRAQVLSERFSGLLERFTTWREAYTVALSTAAGRESSWAIFLVVLAAHVLLFLALVGFFVLHILRLKRPRWLPPVQWVAGIGIALVLFALFFPAGMLPPGDLGQRPGPVTFDPLFLFFLPFGDAPWFWPALALLTVGVALLPWANRARYRKSEMQPRASGAGRRGSPPAMPGRVRIIKDRCTGCTKCALDCPYGAITMVERHDDRPHKYIALEDTDRCVSCGICVGSCDAVAVTLGLEQPEDLWGLVAARMTAPRPTPATAPIGSLLLPIVETAPPLTTGFDGGAVRGRHVVYTCERHALHGAKPYLDGRADGEDWLVIPVPCVGTVAPDLLVRTLEGGAAAVKVVGCPPDDCANREGSLWTEQRLTRQRLPKLRKPYVDAPITADWLPPNAFARALVTPVPQSAVGAPDYAAARAADRSLRPRHYAAAFAILAAVLLVQVLLNNVPYTPHPSPPASIRVVVENPPAPFGAALIPGLLADRSFVLQMVVDGEAAVEQTLDDDRLFAEDARPLLLEYDLPPGEHEIVLRYIGQNTGAVTTLYRGREAIDAGEIFSPAIPLPWVVVCPDGDPVTGARCAW